MPKANINGSGLYYEVFGEGKPLLLIQGFAGGLNAWFRQVPVFKKKYQVIVFDARGLGKSDISPIPYTMSVMEQDVIGLLNHLHIKKAHVLGTSLGGLIVQSVAINYPERVDKLVLVSTFPGTALLGTSAELKKVHDFDLKSGDAGKTMGYFISLAFNKRFYRDMINFLSLLRRKYAYNDYLKEMQSMGHYSVVDRLNLIKAPTLVITGSGDKLIPPCNSEILAARIRGCLLVVVEDGSHAFFLEMSGRFNKEVLKFLDAPYP